MWSVLVVLCAVCSVHCVLAHRREVKDGGNTDVGQPLSLTPLLEQGKVREAQDRSKVKPDIGGIPSYSGYFTVNKACESNLFFWFFPAQKNWLRAPTVLFLQGGPGASSIYSLFEEMGPLTFKENLGKREFSWNVENNLIFIDQPVGTGYSFTGKDCYAQNETVVAEELYSAVVQFHQLFPEIAQNKFIIAGYSYAGHFVPQLGHAIHKNNPSAKVKINLRGMMIGNGWMDGYYQNDLASYLYQIGLIDDEGKDYYYQEQEKFSRHIEKQEWADALRIRGELVSSAYIKYVGNVSILNYLIGGEIFPTPYEGFIQRPEIRKAIHVGNTSFSFENSRVAESLGVAPVLSVKPLVEELLEHYPMVFYYGQLDIICAYPMGVNFLKALNWSGKDQYKSASRQKWCVNGQQVGHFKGSNNLYDVLVRNAGHSVPFDQPFWAYVLANSIIAGSPSNPVQGLTTC